MDIEKHRNTPIRKALLGIFTESNEPYTQVQLHAKLAQHGLSAHKTTLYRILDDLLYHQTISQTTFGDSVQRFELIRAHHHHVVCQQCRRVEDVTIRGDLRSVEKTIARKVKFQSVAHSLEFFGLCQDCARKVSPLTPNL